MRSTAFLYFLNMFGDRTNKHTHLFVEFCRKKLSFQYGSIHSIVTATEKSPKHPSCRHGNRKNAKTSILSPRQSKNTQNMSFCSEMADKEAMNILSRVAQDYDQNEETSFTQYSALYNSTEKTLTVCVMQDYANEYVFSFEK